MGNFVVNNKNKQKKEYNNKKMHVYVYIRDHLRNITPSCV